MNVAQILDVIPDETIFLVGLSLLISATGFYRLVYFVSIGYAFSVAAMASVSAVLFFPHLDLLAALHLVALTAYGLRLGLYLVRREAKPAYRREAEDTQARARGVGVGVKLAIWVSVSLLYLLMFSPALTELDLLRRDPETAGRLVRIIGLVVMLAGLGLEAMADRQKSGFKARHPDRYCSVGLYRWVRCPNYLGEMVFWLGSWVMGTSSYTHWLHWLASAIGLICITLIMMGSTKRLEAKQEERYGRGQDYRRYIATVPVLFPWLPIYSLRNVRVYLE